MKSRKREYSVAGAVSICSALSIVCGLVLTASLTGFVTSGKIDYDIALGLTGPIHFIAVLTGCIALFAGKGKTHLVPVITAAVYLVGLLCLNILFVGNGIELRWTDILGVIAACCVNVIWDIYRDKRGRGKRFRR